VTLAQGAVRNAIVLVPKTLSFRTPTLHELVRVEPWVASETTSGALAAAGFTDKVAS
jgi:hypothetical protein